MAELTLTRARGGLGNTAKGGKRQGHEMPGSFQYAKFGHSGGISRCLLVFFVLYVAHRLRVKA